MPKEPLRPIINATKKNNKKNYKTGKIFCFMKTNSVKIFENHKLLF